MGLNRITSESPLDPARGSVIVAIPVFGAYEQFTQCLRSALRHTPIEVPILVADDASPDPAISNHLEELDEASVLDDRLVYYLRQPENVGFVSNMNTVFEVADGADVVALNSDCVVAERWLESLREAAYSDSLVATASTLTNHGTIVSVPYRNQPQPSFPQDWSFEEAADQVRAGSMRLYPRIPTGIGHCLYIRRTALDLVGNFDEAFAPGYGEEVDFSQRCVLTGLVHVLADDVLVLHHGSASFSQDEAATVAAEHDQIIYQRYGYYQDWVDNVANDRSNRLSSSLAAATKAIAGLTVTVDGRILTRYMTGSQLQTLELIAALAGRTDVQVRVLVPDDLGDYARRILESLPIERTLRREDVSADMDRSHIVHRPYQVSSSGDLELLDMLGERLVITQLDLIAYFNPDYHENFQGWADYCDLTRTAMAMADHVFFISRHGARSAVADGLLDPDRASVIHLGVDHRLHQEPVVPEQPAGMDKLQGRPFMLCIGTDFRHKNRRFALGLLRELRDRHGWDGCLVLAGAHVGQGSSAGSEAAFMALNPELEPHVVEMGAVTEEQKAWLYEQTAAMLYPTAYEGFGLLPFEAAEIGVPCIFGSNSSLAELLPSRVATIEQWNPQISADRVIGLLTNESQRADHVRALRAAAARLTWERTSRDVADAYQSVWGTPVRQSRVMALKLMQAQQEAADGQEAEAVLGYDHIDRSLVTQSKAMTPELERALLGIASRPVLRTTLYRPLLAAYRFMYFVKHRRSARKRFSPKESEETT